MRMNLQLFATTKTSSSGGSKTTTKQTTTGKTTTSETGKSVTNETGKSTTASTGGSTSVENTHTTGTSKTAYTGQVSDNTQQHYNQASQDYQQSQAVTDAYNKLQEVENKQIDFSSQYKDQLDDIYNKINNRGSFNFDMNTDTFYNQMKDQYTAQGKSAMQDTMGQAAALTGGYGSSYSQTASQQAYQDYISQINDNLQDIYEMEADQYNQETSDLYNQYSMTKDMYDTEYDQYRDEVSDWQSDRTYYNDKYANERDFDYTKYSDDREYWTNEYWQEKMAEQTTTSDSYTTGTTDSTNWSNSTTNSTNKSTTNTSNKSVQNTKENVNTTQNTSQWSSSSSQSSGSGSGSSGSSSGSSSSSKTVYDKKNLGVPALTTDTMATIKKNLASMTTAKQMQNYIDSLNPTAAVRKQLLQQYVSPQLKKEMKFSS